MRAYVCSIGEKTTDICVSQLEKYGFDVVMLGGVEAWIDKYKRFIDMASATGQECIRVDADIIVNKNIVGATDGFGVLMAQFKVYDFYKNDVSVGQPCWYSAEGLQIIKKHWNDFYDRKRPESSAWRLEQVNKRTYTSDLIVGMHGFFQDDAHMDRAEINKEDRGQAENFDFKLARKLKSLL